MTSLSHRLGRAARRAPAGLCLLVTALVAGRLAAGAAADSTPAARLGETEITIDEIRPALDALDARERAALARDPALLNQFVRSFLVRRLLLNEATANRWDQQPDVAARLQRLREAAVAESYLESVSKPPDDFPGEAELQSTYEKNKAALLVPRRYRLAQIFLASPAGADRTEAQNIRQRAETIRKKLDEPGADFAALARTESNEPQSAARGGEIGWLTEAQIQPEIRPRVAALAKDVVSDPIKLDDGWHILRVLDIKEAYTPTFDEVRAELARQLRADRLRTNSEAYVAKLLEKTPMAINEIALTQLLNPPKK